MIPDILYISPISSFCQLSAPKNLQFSTHIRINFCLNKHLNCLKYASIHLLTYQEKEFLIRSTRAHSGNLGINYGFRQSKSQTNEHQVGETSLHSAGHQANVVLNILETFPQMSDLQLSSSWA